MNNNMQLQYTFPSLLQSILFINLLVSIIQRSASFVVPHNSKYKLISSSNALHAATLSSSDIDQLASKGYAVIPNFISDDLVAELAKDVSNLRSNSKFKVARIGQDSTNALNEDIRVAETCFLGEGKLSDVPSAARKELYDALDGARNSLSGNEQLDEQDWQSGGIKKGAPALDRELTEMLYAYYPSGGFYRRHRDAVPGSASILRCYSLLLYLNQNWQKEDAGQLRMHFDSGGDFLPDGEEPNYLDVDPKAGTLVLFKSDQVPHEVLDTNSERLAVVGWYNRAPNVNDVNLLASKEDQTRLGMLVVAGLLTIVGLIGVLTGEF